MEEVDWLCVILDKHAKLEKFDFEDLMRAHWLKCHSIDLTEVFVPSQTQLSSQKVKNKSHSDSDCCTPKTPTLKIPGNNN